MKLAQGLIYSKRNFSIKAFVDGLCIMTINVREFLLDSQSNGEFRHKFARKLVDCLHLSVEQSASIACAKVKFLPKFYPRKNIP